MVKSKKVKNTKKYRLNKKKQFGGTKRKGNNNLSPPKQKFSRFQSESFQPLWGDITDEEMIRVERTFIRMEDPPPHPRFDIQIPHKFMARGTYGCGFYPPIQCKEECRDTKCKDNIPRVSKLMGKSDADKEEAVYTKLNLDDIENGSNYFITSPYKCTPNDSFDIETSGCTLKIPKKSQTLLLYENGGYDLMLLNRKFNASLLFILRGLTNILEGIQILNSNGIYHFDIKSDNIVSGIIPDQHISSEITPKFKFIDFGLAYNYKNEKKIRFIHTVKKEDIQPVVDETQPMNSPENHTNAKMETPMPVIKTPIIIRIFPVYQFFITKAFENNDLSEEEYQLLLNKFIDTFLTVEDITVDLVRRYYLSLQLFDFNRTDNFNTPYNKKTLLDLFSKIKESYTRTLEIQKQISDTFDIYSFGLVLLKFAFIQEDKQTPLHKSILDFIIENNILHPNVFKHLSIEDVVHNYKVFMTEVERRFGSDPDFNYQIKDKK